MLKVVEKQDDREAGEELLLLDEIARERLGPKPTITSNAIAASATRTGAPWWFATARRNRASLLLEQERWSCERHGVDDRRATRTGGASISPARSCRPKCAVRSKSPRCCRSCTCAGCRLVIFAPPWNRLWARMRPGCRRTTSRWLTACWEKEYAHFRHRGLSGREYVYVWVDGVHFNIRLEDDRLCTLVMIGTRPDGEKELLAVEDGYLESAESWKTVLRDLKRRGMAAPVLAVADGALGFWAATREVWPETGAQSCWCHKLSNVLDKLPKRLQPRAKRALHEMMYAERRSGCEAARARFEAEYQAKYPKAVESLTANCERLVSFFDFPAEHWKHLRTTNVIESPFATVRLRERATRGAGSRTKGLLMAFELIDMAQQRWRRLDGAHLLPLVRAGVKFVDGVRQARAQSITQSANSQSKEAA